MFLTLPHQKINHFLPLQVMVDQDIFVQSGAVQEAGVIDIHRGVCLCNLEIEHLFIQLS